MLVFRPGRRAHSGNALLRTLLSHLHRLHSDASVRFPGALLEALLRSGELECGLADLNSPHSLTLAALTDALAEMLLSQPPSRHLAALLDRLSRLQFSEQIALSPPEGFAYYALHPLQYANLAQALPLASASAAVIGIRSIGTTLSAAVAAALRRRGLAAERITVRPSGHPFDRKTEFSSAEQCWITAQRARNAEFLVVDEGPGLSGSSFLSVGDALLQAGVPRNSIIFLCATQPDPSRLRARDAARRWPAFRSCAVPRQPGSPSPAGVDVGAGRWRRHLFDIAPNWPASWVTMERAKFLSQDGQQFFKFEGLGHFGSQVAERACALAAAGFSPACEDMGDGYFAYHKERSLPATRMDLCPLLLDRLAEYCAFRAADFRASALQGDDLAAMAAWNLHEEFGIHYQPQAVELEIKIPVVPDARMQPHEWLLTSDGILKVDGASHGDDHFFPGPADIAWDLAGVIVEWDLGRETMDYFLRRYTGFSGDQACSRVPGWLQAYTAFRIGYCKMAAESLSGTEEEERLLRDYRRYRARARTLLPHSAAA